MDDDVMGGNSVKNVENDGLNDVWEKVLLVDVVDCEIL